ncbi:MAG: class I SAM-dependent methyltransferase [Eubacterium sp.]|nr:class I SAM-dependent methyltransferase [Eubacterium sp.]
MSEYHFFARVYDRMMENIPYEDWEQYILQLLYKYNISPYSKIAELGCGTGTMTELLSDEGFLVTGIDLSEDMLTEAEAKLRYAKARGIRNRDITYLNQDMRELSLQEKQSAIISICDSMNYLLSTDDLYRTMKAAKDNLKDDGIFIFDLKTEYFFQTELDRITFRDDLGDFSYIWKNRYDGESRIHKYGLVFRIRGKDGIRYEKEVHRQRVFTAAEIKEAAIKAGFSKAVAYDAFTFDKPKIKSDRIYIVCRQS